MNVHIAKFEDIDTLVEMGCAIYSAHFNDIWSDAGLNKYLETEFSESRIEKELSNPDLYSWLLLTDPVSNQLIGFVKIKWVSLIPGTNSSGAELCKIYFTPNATGHGYGTKALSSVETMAIKKGATCVWLDVLKSNVRGYEFYKGNGFIHLNEIPFSTDISNIGLFVMSKALSHTNG